jgi:hypothetical protein
LYLTVDYPSPQPRIEGRGINIGKKSRKRERKDIILKKDSLQAGQDFSFLSDDFFLFFSVRIADCLQAGISVNEKIKLGLAEIL